MLKRTKGQLSGVHTHCYPTQAVRSQSTQDIHSPWKDEHLIPKTELEGPEHSTRLSGSLQKHMSVFPAHTQEAAANSVPVDSWLSSRGTLGPTFSLSLVRDCQGLCCVYRWWSDKRRWYQNQDSRIVRQVSGYSRVSQSHTENLRPMTTKSLLD